MEETGESAFDVKDILALLKRRWRLIAAFTLTLGGLGLLLAMSLANVYEGVATVQIDPRKKTVVSVESVLPDIVGDTATIESQVEIIRSNVIAQRVIEVLHLRDDPELLMPPLYIRVLRKFPVIGKSFEAAPNPNRPPESYFRRDFGSFLGPEKVGQSEPIADGIIGSFLSRLKVYRVRNSLLIEIAFTSEDPVKAAKIANTIAEMYVRDQVETKIKATSIAAELLEKKIQKQRDEVSALERKVSAFKAKNGIFESEGHVLSEKRLARLMEQTVIARNSTSDAQAKFERVQRMLAEGQPKSAVAEVLQSNTVQSLKDQLVRVTRKEAELATKYGPKHPSMIKARAEVADVESKLATEIEEIVANLKNQYEIAKGRERELVASLDRLKRDETLTKDATIELQQLQRDAIAARQLLEHFMSRHKQMLETESIQIPDARIVNTADIPLQSAGPKRRQIVLIATAAGFMIGFALAFLMDLMIPGFRKPDEVERSLRIEYLSAVPMIEGPADPVRAARLMLAAPLSSFAEAMRFVRHEIDARRTSGSRVILVTSALPNEGRSVIASNLAHHYAMTGGTTLLVDGDLRRGALTRQLAPGRQAGLLDCLASGRGLERAILEDSATNLAFLPADTAAPVQIAPPEALSSQQFAAELARLKSRYQTIVIDCPPLLPVVDTRILADHADQILFVMAWQRTPKELAKRAVRGLAANAAKIVGVVVNQMDPMEHSATLGVRQGRAAGNQSVQERAA